MPARPRKRDPRTDFHPLRHTTASVMLAVAVDATDRTMTEMGLAMGYGAANRSSLSHMASGIQPIPVDKAETIARVVGLDEQSFTMAVLHQRHPEAAEALWGFHGIEDPAKLPGTLLVAMRERLLNGDRGFARSALSIISRPLPWNGVADAIAKL